MNERKTLRTCAALSVAAALFCAAARAPARAQSSLDDFTVTLRPPASDVAVVLKAPVSGGGTVDPGGGGGTVDPGGGGTPPPQPSTPAAEPTALGGGADTIGANGGQEIKVVEGKPRVQPNVATSDWSTSVQIESWGSGGRRGISGTRTTMLMGYTRGLTPADEIAVNVPIHSISLGGGTANRAGTGDTEVAYRHVFFDAEAQGGTTWTLAGRLFLPTGSYRRGTGLGEFGFGPSLSVSRPMGHATLGYGGVSYVISGKPSGARASNVLSGWAGGFTTLAPRWSVQYEAVHFNSAADEAYPRLMVGVRYAVTPTRGLQLNIKQELQADGKPTAVTLGYSARL